ncbi:hypothetical protein I4U23_005539 [Adineta vaga]|nr:hypothetical protein I4U23_005539 [Adineta vaga]
MTSYEQVKLRQLLTAIQLICLSFSIASTHSFQTKFKLNQAAHPNASSAKIKHPIGDHTRFTSSTNTTLQYFGYWGLGMYGLDVNISVAADHSNLVFISDISLEALEIKIRQAENFQLQSMIMVQGMVFPWRQFSMYVDWQSRWDQFQTTIVNNHVNSIAGFYIFDEPFHSFDVNYNGTDKQTAALKFNWQLTQLANYIKTKNPSKVVTLTYAYIELEPYVSKFGIQSSIDWIGVNCYLEFGSVCSETNLVKYFTILNNLREPQHQFMLTLDAYTSQRVCLVNESKQEAIINRIDFVLSWTRSNIPVIALTPFLYQELHDSAEDLCGAGKMPFVFDKLKAIAQTYIHKIVVPNLIT